MYVWTCCEHQTNKQTKKRTMFSNVKMPIAHQISICFHVDGFFFTLVVVCYCCYCMFFHCIIYQHSKREAFIVYNLTVLLFVVHDTAGTFVFFYSSSSSSSSPWSFIFLFRQFNQSLDQCLDFKQITVSKKYVHFFFHLVYMNEVRFLHVDFFL